MLLFGGNIEMSWVRKGKFFEREERRRTTDPSSHTQRAFSVFEKRGVFIRAQICLHKEGGERV